MDPITTILGLALVLAPAAWMLARLASAEGFGGTFLRPNPDLGWPHGVQEDDDFRWRWERPDEPVRQRPGLRRAPPVRPVRAAPLGPSTIAPRVADPVDPAPLILEGEVARVDVTPVRRVH